MNKTSVAPAIDDLLKYNRYTAVTSAAFGTEEVTLLSVTGVEQLSEPFRYEVRIVCRRRIRNFTQVIGKPITVGLKLSDGRTRYFNGIVRQFSYVGIDDARRPIYAAEVVPWLLLLDYRRNSRIFQDMTSLEIAKAIFAEHSAAVFKDMTQTTPPRRTFCVQYDETDFAFISRLLEQDGIYYFFVHKKDQHELILGDSSKAHEPCNPRVIDTNLSLERSRFSNDLFWEWNESVSLQPGQVVLRDYDHEKPAAELTSLAPVPSVRTGGVPTLDEDRAYDRLGGGPSGEQRAMTVPGPDAGQRELFIYPGRYTEKVDGDFYAKVRAEELGSRAYRVRVTGSARQLCPGNIFQAANPFEITDTKLAPKPTVSYLALRAEIEIRGESGEKDNEDEQSFLYRCSIEAQPADNQYRPPLRTPRPVIAGPQTAVTVGRPGETITTDLYGRIKVQFFWDRQGKKNENSSCWIRVAQNWAGKNFGGLVTPRVGQEVVVEFISGNPDWPIVTGAVYNATNLPPEELPAKATRSTFKTRSDGGTVNDFNELSFEDQLGVEEVYLKAQKDWKVDVGSTYVMTLPWNAASIVTPPQSLSKLGSQIVATPEKISFIVSSATGKQAIEITSEGIFVIGTTIGLLATGGQVTSTPPPVPVPSPLLTKAATELELALPEPAPPPAYNP